jgi:hypothetical protein
LSPITYIIELSPAVESVDTLPAHHVTPDDRQVFFERVPADVLKMLANQLRGFRHVVALIRH